MKTNKSSYCDYNDTFTGYDQVRQPNALKEIECILNENTVPASEQRVLEGGFGTGAYIEHIRHQVKEIHGIEGSDEGFARASEKMNAAENVFLQIGNILDLPFSNDHFNAYMINQVLHHIDSDQTFSNLDVFLKEAVRVLVPGGSLLINTCSQEQLDPETGVYWNYKYIEKAAQALRSRYIPLEDLVLRLKNSGFDTIKISHPSAKIYNERYYNDPSIGLESDFRKGDSIYSLLSADEIAQSNQFLSQAIQDGTALTEMKRAAEKSDEIGEVVLVSARKAN